MPADPAKPSALPFASRGTGKRQPQVRMSPVSKQILGQIAARSGFKSEGAVIAMLIDSYANGPDARQRGRVRQRCLDIVAESRAAYRQTVGGSPVARRLQAIESAAIELAAMMAGPE